jgi:hypothetical protein
MVRPGRKPQTTGHVDHVGGSPRAKARLTAILKTLSGEWTVPQACATVGLHEAQFHTLRHMWLEGAVALLEPKPVGRPPHAADPQHEADQQRIADLERHVALATAQREVAEVLGAAAVKKGAPVS